MRVSALSWRVRQYYRVSPKSRPTDGCLNDNQITREILSIYYYSQFPVAFTNNLNLEDQRSRLEQAKAVHRYKLIIVRGLVD
jgi:hypothetical protein